MRDDELDPQRDDDQFRLDVSAQLGDIRRTIHETYAGEAGIGPRTLENRRLISEVKNEATPGGIAGIIREGSTQMRRTAVEMPNSTFGKIVILVLLAILFTLALRWSGDASIKIGGTTVERQQVQEQDIGQVQVLRPVTPGTSSVILDPPEVIPPPPPIDAP